jgi:hypothetical protein
MKYVEIGDGLLINIEHIYALSIESNRQDVIDWENTYDSYIKSFYDNPIELNIDGKLYAPDFKTETNKELLEKYINALQDYIIELLGVKPEYVENYFTILASGNRVNLSKEVYDKLYKYIKDNEKIEVLI